ncbi:MAG: response regulator, partial [Rhizobiaceae bacterium]
MKKILYVEDNEDNVFMLQMRLELEGGYELSIAANGTDGLSMAKAQKPDLILMDVNLPDIDGLEVTRRIKAYPEIAHIPVIALTSNAMSGDREKALAAGCDGFDTKPVDFDRLLRL